MPIGYSAQKIPEISATTFILPQEAMALLQHYKMELAALLQLYDMERGTNKKAMLVCLQRMQQLLELLP